MFWALLMGQTGKNIGSAIDCRKLEQIKEMSANPE